jgi:hypothetical protein
MLLVAVGVSRLDQAWVKVSGMEEHLITYMSSWSFVEDSDGHLALAMWKYRLRIVASVRIPLWCVCT